MMADARPPGGGNGAGTFMRRPPFQVLFVALATALVLPGDSILYAVLPTYYAEIGLTPIQVGILLSANRWVRLISKHCIPLFQVPNTKALFAA